MNTVVAEPNSLSMKGSTMTVTTPERRDTERQLLDLWRAELDRGADPVWVANQIAAAVESEPNFGAGIEPETCGLGDAQPVSAEDHGASGLCQEHLDARSHDTESQRHARLMSARADGDDRV